MSAPSDAPLTPNDCGHLLAGQVYATAEPYADFDGVLHPRGETWTFLAHELYPEDDGLVLHVRHPAGERGQIRLQQRPEAQGAVVAALPYYLERLELLPRDHALRCACEQARWRVATQLSALGPDVPSGFAEAARGADLELLTCEGCGLLVAVEARPQGHALLPLDLRRRRAVLRALELDPAGPVGALIEAALACTTHPANQLVARHLAARPSFVTEVSARLASTRAEERLPALELVAPMRPTPPLLADGVVRALGRPLDADAVSDERLRVLLALHPLAAEACAFRDDVAALLAAVGAREGELADLLRRAATAVLARMDAAVEGARAARRTAVEGLAGLVLEGDLAGADARALALEPEERHANGVPGRARLWEETGDALAGRDGDAAALAWWRAHALWCAHAASPSSEADGEARTRDAERVAAKLERLSRG